MENLLIIDGVTYKLKETAPGVTKFALKTETDKIFNTPNVVVNFYDVLRFNNKNYAYFPIKNKTKNERIG